MTNLSHKFVRTPVESASPARMTARAPNAAWANASLGRLASALALAPTGLAADDAELAPVPREIMKKAVADARAAIAQIALKYAGTGARNQPDRYLEILASPGDEPETLDAMRTWSSRLLFARGVLRKSGVEDDCFGRDYAGDAAGDVEYAACRRRAWVDVSRGARGKMPQQGDVVLLVDGQPYRYNPRTGDPIYRERFVVLVGSPRPKNPGRFLVDTVEGGHGAGGREIRAFGVPEQGASKAQRRPRVIYRSDNGWLWMDHWRIDGWVDAAKVTAPIPALNVPRTRASSKVAAEVPGDGVAPRAAGRCRGLGRHPPPCRRGRSPPRHARRAALGPAHRARRDPRHRRARRPPARRPRPDVTGTPSPGGLSVGYVSTRSKTPHEQQRHTQGQAKAAIEGGLKFIRDVRVSGNSWTESSHLLEPTLRFNHPQNAKPPGDQT
jgi:hypothetical protein